MLVLGRTAVAVASLLALAGTAAGWTMLDRFQDSVTSSEVLREIPDAPSADDAATDILLVGNDSRTDAQGNPLPLSVLKELRTESTNGLNTDTLILVRVPHNGSAPTAVSVPRDTLVQVPDSRPEKANAVYGLAKRTAADGLRADGITDSSRVERESALAGQRTLVRSVQQLTGVRIDHYAEVNLLGFYEVTEAIGGVDVCLNQATSDKDSGADFAAGEQTIAGGDALSFVRQRHGLPRGDLDRIVRQQVFMAALANKVLSTGTLTDPAKLEGLMAAARKSVVLDQEWDIVGFAQQMQGLASGGVHFVTLPVADVGARDDRGQSIVTVDPNEARRFVDGLASGPPGQRPAGIAPAGAMRLDGTAHRQTPTEDSPTPPEPGTAATDTPVVPDPPPRISSTGIPCVN
ncbi:LytR family transcriptional regulator [Allosaccharopolyspora coralli]|uniref:LytR family transcriptional regulator n=1 Tax=Allosaccharopolyspora coralli TaxID=2665642 RepID=A0A5Q3QIG2_9PSEU|nr:LCP family protein [Allosaccharopolyspora coralli]QGK71315.1 LytR family transcriptional regulator [Allosaccharopolyspora coralli]